MPENDCLVSIGMPVYNDKMFLRAAITSIINQTHSNFELIISDDHSTDGSDQVCLEMAKEDGRIKYFRQSKNIGISRNMEFLLKKSKGEYFMWAGDDDVWDVDFILMLLDSLKKNPSAIVSFCNVVEIDEDDNLLNKHDRNEIDYSGNTPLERLKKLVNTFYDGFGYGLFVKEKITDVQFPLWWWINKSRAYNNIYPSLCYYLTKGEYIHVDGKPLWFNRFKNKQNINHKNVFENNFIRGNFAFALWKFNLVVCSLKSIRRAGGNLNLTMAIFFPMISRWFIKPSYNYFKTSGKKLFRGQIKIW